MLRTSPARIAFRHMQKVKESDVKLYVLCVLCMLCKEAKGETTSQCMYDMGYGAHWKGVKYVIKSCISTLTNNIALSKSILREKKSPLHLLNHLSQLLHCTLADIANPTLCITPLAHPLLSLELCGHSSSNCRLRNRIHHRRGESLRPSTRPSHAIAILLRNSRIITKIALGFGTGFTRQPAEMMFRICLGLSGS